MKDLINAFDELPKIIKIILCLPGIDIVWGIYRIIRSADKNSVLGIILGVITIFPGSFLIWIIDIISVILNDKIWWFDK